MLLDDPTNRQASESESSLAEGSFSNGQQEVLLDEVREFQPSNTVEQADKQIYADTFNYIPPEQRQVQRAKQKAKPKQDQQAVREKVKQIKNQKPPEKKKQPQKKFSPFQEEKIDKAKKLSPKNKDKDKVDPGKSNKENPEQESLAQRLKPDTKKLVHDATHGDPRQVVGDLADQYLHAGRRMGDILFLVWGLLSIITLPTIIGGIFSLMMLNLLLVSPNTNFRITRWLLEFILDFFGVGEVLTVAMQFGVTKIDVKINFIEKLGIIFIDVAIFVILIAIIALATTLICHFSGLDGTGWIATILGGPAGWAIDLYRGDKLGSSVINACQQFNSK